MTPYYDRDGITIYHGDWRNVRLALPHVDHVLTDPPYDLRTHRGGMRYDSEKKKPVRALVDAFDPITEQDMLDLVGLMAANVERWMIVFCPMESLGKYAELSGDAWVRAGFYRKLDGSPQFYGDRPAQAGEGIAIMHRMGLRKRWNARGKLGYWESVVEHRNSRYHPTQKPLKLIKQLLADFVRPGEIVLDPYMGSGTTLRAAKDLGMRAIGIDISEEYCEIAVKRLRQEVLL